MFYHQPIEPLGGAFRGSMCRSHSHTTLHLSAYTHQHDGNSDSDCENMKPMKRSRSDQSLNTTVQHLLAAGSSGGGGSSSGGGGSSAGHHLYAATPLRSCASEGAPVRGDAAPGGRSQRQPSRMPSLPVVLSDGSSSTNSLLSLESAEQRSATLLSVPAGEQQQQQQPGVLASSQMQRSSSDVVYCLNVSSSAASLSQVTQQQQQQERQLGAAGTSQLSSCSDVTRTASDASSASQGYASLLQQYSPPSLLPPGPVLDGDAAAQQQGPHRAGLSIQQQKQASFVQPQPPAAAAAAAAAAGAGVSSSSWGVRPVAHGSTASLLSCDSVASAEASEHLARPLRYGQQQQQATSDSPGTSATQRQPSQHQLPPLSPPLAGGSGSWARSTVRSSSCSGAVGGTAPSPVAAGVGGSAFTSPGWGGSESAAGSRTAGGSPALQLQSVGSLLGDDGSWLLGEASTGAIGALSPSAFLGSEQLALHDQQQQQQHGEQLAAAESADASLRLAAAAAPAAAPAVSAAMPAPQVSRASAYFTSLPLTPGLPRGSFGFGQAGAAGAGGVAAAAAAAAQLGLLGSGGAPGSSGSGSAAAAAAFGAAAGSSPGMPPAAAFAACRSGATSSGGIVSAPLPNMSCAPQSGNGRRGYGGSSFAGHSVQDQWQFHQSPYPPRSSQQGETHWNFPRRPASFDCSRVSLSGRRRGSLELNMPWRKTLDAAIARAAAESGGAADAPASPALGARASSCGGCSTSARDASDSGPALGLAASEAEGMFGAATALAVAGGSWQHPRARRASQLELLMPLAEGDAEAAPGSPCGGCGPGSIGPGSMGSGAHGSSEDGDAASTTTSSRRSGDSGTGSSTSGAQVAADHDLPGSTNIGGYIGGSDGLGLSRHSLENPTAAAAAAAAAVAAAAKHHTLHQAASAPAMSMHSHHHQQQQQQGMEECDDASVAAAQLSPLSRSAAQLQQSHGAASPSASLDHHVHRLQQEQVVVVTQSSESSEGDRCEVDEEDDDASDEEDWCASSSSSTHAAAKQQPASAFGPMHSQQHASGQGGLQSYQSTGSISSISSRASCALYSGGGCARQRGGGAMAGASRDLELFVRLNRARQTLDFAKRQAQAFAELDRAELSVWEALDLLDSLREVEAGLLAAATGSGGSGSGGPDDAGAPSLTPDMSLKEHAFQVAELCRLSFPDKPWMALVGLLHGLGKLLSHPLWGSQPAWAVAGESFPVGCRFAPQISASEFFSANPDRRRRAYSTGLGVYTEHCGLRNVYMSWGGPEYLYMALVLNQTGLPEEALSLIRYQRCTALSRGAYRQLMTPEDAALLPLLADFQALLTYRRVPLPPGALRGAERAVHYDALIRTYLGEERLYW